MNWNTPFGYSWPEIVTLCAAAGIAVFAIAHLLGLEGTTDE